MRRGKYLEEIRREAVRLVRTYRNIMWVVRFPG